MATWEQILVSNPEDAQAFLEIVDQVMRPAAGELAQVIKSLRWLSGVSEDPDHSFAIILDLIDGETEMPYRGGLAGATMVTGEDIHAEVDALVGSSGLLEKSDKKAGQDRRRRLAGINVL